jgi:hypothetical protein
MFAELLFAMLPFGVIFLVFAFQQRSLLSYLMAPEWAFASSALFGQTIVKFVQGITSSKKGRAITERINLLVSALIVFGMVPSMTVLAIMLVSTAPPVWLGFAQVGLALLAAFVFVVIGTISYELERG